MVVTDINDGAPPMVEEQFFPAIPVTTYRTLDATVARANNTVYGLGGSVWRRNIDRAVAVVRRLEAGTVWVNTHGTESINRKAPYGGIKQSGIGREAGLKGVEEYLHGKRLRRINRVGAGGFPVRYQRRAVHGAIVRPEDSWNDQGRQLICLASEPDPV